MQFNKSKVYTALNADELEVGSMVIVADSLDILRDEVKEGDKKSIVKLTRIADEMDTERFCVNGTVWAFAYLVSLSDNQLTAEYEPFSDTKTAYEAINSHGGWVINEDGAYLAITGINIGRENNEEILVGQIWHSSEYIFETCTFADNGSLVGQRIEDCGSVQSKYQHSYCLEKAI